MRVILFGLAFVAVAYAQSSEYLPPHQEFSVEVSAPSNEYLAPAAEEQTVLADDGYRYKTVRRFRHRNRRDVNELVNSEYLPPTQEYSGSVAAPTNEYLAPAAEEQTVLADDGYRYKTVRRFRHRNRRDVNELVNSEYLPPTQEYSGSVAAPSNEYLAPAAEEQTVLADDGYRYKTVRRFRLRNRRDVNELVNSEYLPPTQEYSGSVAAPSNEYLAPAAEEQTVLADDGYRYKTVRRFRHRNRRDVNELVNSEYLPPTQEYSGSVAAPTNEYLAPAAEEQTVLADDGYRYKTVRRFRHRNRRDVNELVNSEYLPPTQEYSGSVAAPSNEYLAPAAEEQTVLADDGYRYKTVRRFRHRNRRDVNELVNSEYLPPTQEYSGSVAAPTNEYLAPAAEEQTVLADDGYRYKTVRRFRLRNRRDVNELVNSEYLPPTQEYSASVAAPSNDYLPPASDDSNVLASDGYRYKTVRRFKIRRH